MLKFLAFRENHMRSPQGNCHCWSSYLPPYSCLTTNWGHGWLPTLPGELWAHCLAHVLTNWNRLPGGRNAVCCCNCMLARACWYWKIPVLKTAVAPLVFSRAGLFGNGGSTAWGIPCLVNEYKKQRPVKREKEKRKISWRLKLLGSMSKQAAEHLTTKKGKIQYAKKKF